MITSNGASQTLGSTSGDALAKLWTVPAGTYTLLTVSNFGAADGFFTVDAGVNLAKVPAGASISFPNPPFVNGGLIQIQRVASAADMTSVQAVLN